MAHDVFISYASEDLPLVEAVCAELERGGIRCWYAPRDVDPGTKYQVAIVDAINDCRLVLLLLSSHSNESEHVEREIENAYATEVRRPVLPVRIENVKLSKSLKYYLSSVQWFDASAPPFESHLRRLVTHLQARLSRPAPDGGTQQTTPPAPTSPRPPTPKEQPAEPRFNLGLAGMFSSGAPDAAAARPAPPEPRPDVAPSARRTGGGGFFYKLGRLSGALRPSRMAPALKWTLSVVAASLLVLVAGFVAIRMRLDNPVPEGDVIVFTAAALIFLLLESLFTYFHVRRVGRLGLLRWLFLASGAAVLLLAWNAYYVRVYIFGHVLDQAKTPIQGVQVSLRDGSGNDLETFVTGWNGSYDLGAHPPGGYRLYVDGRPSYAPLIISIDASHRSEYVLVTLGSTGPGGLESQGSPPRPTSPQR